MKRDDIPKDVLGMAERVCENFRFNTVWHESWAEDVARAILAERERCATVADSETLAHRNRQTEAATAHDEESHLLHALLAQQSDKIAAEIRKGGE